MEQVLVFNEELIAGLKADAPSGILTDRLKVSTYLKAIMSGVEFIDRAAAETDPAFKQLIPYAVLMKGRMVFRYQRTKKADEQRLHGNWSIGLGGHINPIDGEPTNRNTYWQGFHREMCEEAGDLTQWDAISTPIVALIYDDSNEVGRVHLGVVHRVQLEHSAPLRLKDESMANGEFRHILDIKRKDVPYENWSNLVIDQVL